MNGNIVEVAQLLETRKAEHNRALEQTSNLKETSDLVSFFLFCYSLLARFLLMYIFFYSFVRQGLNVLSRLTT